uniref:Protein kinase domain-containing protein n=1 Tax=Panagrellus redivivus TaxID=6233 RepID=A0A7E4W174_PANRE
MPLRSVALSFPAASASKLAPTATTPSPEGFSMTDDAVAVTIEATSDSLDMDNFLFAPDSFSWQWLPSAHDTEAPNFTNPRFVGADVEHQNGRTRASLSFHFPVSVVTARSTFRVRIHDIEHAVCSQVVDFEGEPRTDVHFACENAADGDCFTAVPPYSPLCVSAENVSVSLSRTAGAYDAVIETRGVAVNVGKTGKFDPKLQYAALFGPCSPTIESYGFRLAVRPRKDKCQLRIDAIWKQSICRTPFENCAQTNVIRIPNVSPPVEYGLLLCVFRDAVPFPDNQTMLQQLALAKRIKLPATKFSTSFLNDGQMKTYLAYGAILLILFALLLITLIQKKRQRKPLAADMLQFLKADEWELNDSDILIHYAHKIGHGSTAEVYKGKLSKDFKTPANGPVVLDETQQVAVKILKKNATEAQKAEFLSEMEINKLLGRNTRIVDLIGVMQLRRPPLIVFEILPNGDLRRWLHKCRQYALELDGQGYHLADMDDINAIPQVNEEFVFTLKRIIRLAIQIVLGMEYLASRQLIHADIATRNVFITAKNSLKLGDFGMCRKESDTSKLRSCVLTDNRARWAAPEILTCDAQYLASDVWSFGIVLYELITLGAIPYHNVSDATTSLAPLLIDSGYRLRRPKLCPQKVYDIMTNCWIANPLDRPSISSITNSLTDLYDGIETKDNHANFYVTPDPDPDLYLLPSARRPDTSPNPASLGCHVPMGPIASNAPSPTDSPAHTIRDSNPTASTVPPAILELEGKRGHDKKIQLLQEAERLLGFS